MAIPITFPLNIDQITSISFPDLSKPEPAPTPAPPVEGESPAAEQSRELRNEQAKTAAEKRKEMKDKMLEKLKSTIKQKLDEVNKGLVDMAKGEAEIIANVGEAGVLKDKITATETLNTVIKGVNTDIKALSSTPAAPAATPMGSMNDNQLTAEENKLEAWKSQHAVLKNQLTSALARVDSGISSVNGFCDLLQLTKVPAVSTFLGVLNASYSACDTAVSSVS